MSAMAFQITDDVFKSCSKKALSFCLTKRPQCGKWMQVMMFSFFSKSYLASSVTKLKVLASALNRNYGKENRKRKPIEKCILCAHLHGFNPYNRVWTHEHQRQNWFQGIANTSVLCVNENPEGHKYNVIRCCGTLLLVFCSAPSHHLCQR